MATTWAHAVYSKEAYSPFGETYKEAGTPDRSFTGQDQDVAPGAGGSGTYDFLFRKYDPAAGRWLSPDPAGWGAVDQTTPQSLNRYAYVENNPMSLTDLYGLYPVPCPNGSGLVVSSDGSFYSEACDSSGNYSNYSQYAPGCDPNADYLCSLQYQQFTQLSNVSYSNLSLSGAPSNGYVSNYPSFKGLFCTGDALAAKGLSIGLDVVGAIPGLGNLVSAGAAGARAVDAVVTWGGGVLGAATSLDDPVGAASSGAGLGLALANVTIQSTKVIPGIGNFISAGTGIYDAYGAYKAYRSCMSSSKYD